MAIVVHFWSCLSQKNPKIKIPFFWKPDFCIVCGDEKPLSSGLTFTRLVIHVQWTTRNWKVPSINLLDATCKHPGKKKQKERIMGNVSKKKGYLSLMWQEKTSKSYHILDHPLFTFLFDISMTTSVKLIPDGLWEWPLPPINSTVGPTFLLQGR